MIEVVAKLALLLLAAVFGGIWVHAVVNWDGVRNCDHDCEHCPFPPTDYDEDRKL